jgi:hypothetical protein
MIEDKEIDNIERLGLLRNSSMAPYISLGWDIKADYPKERRVVLQKTKKFSVGWFIVGLIFYLVPGLIYLLVWSLTKNQEKTLMY